MSHLYLLHVIQKIANKPRESRKFVKSKEELNYEKKNAIPATWQIKLCSLLHPIIFAADEHKQEAEFWGKNQEKNHRSIPSSESFFFYIGSLIVINSTILRCLKIFFFLVDFIYILTYRTDSFNALNFLFMEKLTHYQNAEVVVFFRCWRKLKAFQRKFRL